MTFGGIAIIVLIVTEIYTLCKVSDQSEKIEKLNKEVGIEEKGKKKKVEENKKQEKGEDK